MKSACRPGVTPMLSGMLFTVGCEATGQRWYRMLRPDGHPILKAYSPSQEMEQSTTNSDAEEFAVRVITAVRAMSPGQPFRKRDLQSEVVSVYRSSDGRRVFATSLAEVPLAEQSFAVSPSGRQLALLGNSGISFYPMEKSAEGR